MSEVTPLPTPVGFVVTDGVFTAPGGMQQRVGVLRLDLVTGQCVTFWDGPAIGRLIEALQKTKADIEKPVLQTVKPVVPANGRYTPPGGG